MGRQSLKTIRRQKRQKRVRRRLLGTADRPRLAVYRSLKHIYAQVVDDTANRVIAAASSLSADVRKAIKAGGTRAAAVQVGGRIAQAALAEGVTKVVFDRRGYRYHGRVQALADAARKGGLSF